MTRRRFRWYISLRGYRYRYIGISVYRAVHQRFIFVATCCSPWKTDERSSSCLALSKSHFASGDLIHLETYILPQTQKRPKTRKAILEAHREEDIHSHIISSYADCSSRRAFVSWSFRAREIPSLYARMAFSFSPRSWYSRAA